LIYLAKVSDLLSKAGTLTSLIVALP